MHARGRVFQAPLVAYFTIFLTQDEECMLAHHYQVVLARDLVVVVDQVLGGFADIGRPIGLEEGLLRFLLGFLLGDVVIGTGLQGDIGVALQLEVGVCEDQAVYLLRIDEGAGDEEVRQLDLKEHLVVLEEEQSAIHRLHAEHGLLRTAELPLDHVVRVPIECMLVQHVEGSEILTGEAVDHTDDELPRVKHGQGDVLLRALRVELAALHLQDGQAHVPLNDHILQSECPLLRMIHAQVPLE